MKSLYKMCAGHATLPRSLNFELRDNTGYTPLFRGGSADVSRCEHDGKEVAVKVLRVQGSLRDMTSVSDRRASVPMDVLVNRTYRI